MTCGKIEGGHACILEPEHEGECVIRLSRQEQRAAERRPSLSTTPPGEAVYEHLSLKGWRVRIGHMLWYGVKGEVLYWPSREQAVEAVRQLKEYVLNLRKGLEREATKCTKHPKYAGKRKTKCEDCMKYYEAVHD